MRNRTVWIAISLLTGFYTACSNVRFDSKADLRQYGGQCQQISNTEVQCSGSETVSGGKVDVLIVNDNSASMSFEQARLSQRFNNFLSLLDSKFMDYRIGVTTTDISDSKNTPRAVNLNGELQDGRLISFSNGKKYLTAADGSVAEKTTLFNSIVNRNETINCENFINSWVGSGKSIDDPSYSPLYDQNCPSSDERGIYAANLTIQNNPNSFVRPEADLAVIFLSDEDVRSQLYDPFYSIPGFPLESLDTGASLTKQIQEKYPKKSFGVHAIVTKDTACLTQQRQQISGLVNGSMGNEYYRAIVSARNAMAAMGYSSDVTAKMVLGDICSNDYTGQLQQIFDHIQGQIKDSINLGCENPKNLQVSLSLPDPSITWSVAAGVLKFNKKLPLRMQVNYSFTCAF